MFSVAVISKYAQQSHLKKAKLIPYKDGKNSPMA
jgi:hypothetical protein